MSRGGNARKTSLRFSAIVTRGETDGAAVRVGDRAIQLSLSPVLSRRVDTPQDPPRGLRLHSVTTCRIRPLVVAPSGDTRRPGITASRNNAPYFSQPPPQLSNDLSARDVRPGIN